MRFPKFILPFICTLVFAQTFGQNDSATNRAVLKAIAVIKEQLKVNNLAVHTECMYTVRNYVKDDLAREYFADLNIIRKNYYDCNASQPGVTPCKCNYFSFAITPGTPKDFKYVAMFSPMHDNAVIVRVGSSIFFLEHDRGATIHGKNYFFLFKFNSFGELIKTTNYYIHID